MQITWEGKDIIKIISEKNTIVVNPDKKTEATVVIEPKNKEDFKNSFVITNPGEYEINDDFFFVDLFKTKDKKSLVYRFNIEDINIIDLNNITGTPEVTETDTDSSYENIVDNKVDILILPIGEGFLDVKEAISIRNEYSPKLVLAINYSESEADVKKFTEFKKSFTSSTEPQDKFKITKKSLPGQDDDVILVVLNATK